MSIPTPKDSFDRAAILGNYNGTAVPIKAAEDGSMVVAGGSLGGSKYELTYVLSIDLSTSREKERFNISFDSFAIADIKGSFFMYVNKNDDDVKCTINKCLFIGVCGEAIYITNESQAGAHAEVWFFKEKD